MLGLTPGSYEAFCFDQAAWYLGTTITSEIDKAGQKKQKGEAAMRAAKERVLKKFLDGRDAPGLYADPIAAYHDNHPEG